MSDLVGHLRLSTRGGKDLFVFDDCFVQAWTGFGTALSVALDNASSSGVGGMLGGALGGPAINAGTASLSARLTGSRAQDLTMTPEQIRVENKGNRLIRFDEIATARLTGKPFGRGQRRLVVNDTTWGWTGAKVVRPLNDDSWAVPLLQAV